MHSQGHGRVTVYRQRDARTRLLLNSHPHTTCYQRRVEGLGITDHDSVDRRGQLISELTSLNRELAHPACLSR